MNCPKCGTKTGVIDARPNQDGNQMRRRRECTACGFRFTTYERADPEPDERIPISQMIGREMDEAKKSIEIAKRLLEGMKQ